MIDSSTLILTVLGLGIVVALGDTFWALATGTLRLPPRYRRRLKFDVQALVAAIVFLLVIPTAAQLLLVPRGEHQALSARNIEVSNFANFTVIIALLAVLAYRPRNTLTDYGIEFQGFRDEMHYGALGFLASLPPVIVVLVLTASFRSPETKHPFLKLLEETGSSRAMFDIVFAAVVSAPLMEELVFRVLLQGLLETAIPPSLAILVPAVAFAAVHGPFDALPLFPLAVILGIVFHLRHSYVSVVTLHALFNAFFLILGLWSRHAG